MEGPTVQRELISTLINFRLNNYVLTADISKMNMTENSNLFWQNIREHKLNTAIYGMSSALFSVVPCLFELPNIHGQSKPIGSDLMWMTC